MNTTTELCFYGRYDIVAHQVMVALREEGFYVAQDICWNNEVGDYRKVIMKRKG